MKQNTTLVPRFILFIIFTVINFSLTYLAFMFSDYEINQHFNIGIMQCTHFALILGIGGAIEKYLITDNKPIFKIKLLLYCVGLTILGLVYTFTVGIELLTVLVTISIIITILAYIRLR